MSQILEREGDLFDAPENAALIRAYRIYRSHCQKYLLEQKKGGEKPSDATRQDSKIQGTALLIPPQPEDYGPFEAAVEPPGKRQRVSRGGQPPRSRPQPAGKKHWIVCLFTSWHFSAKLKSAPDEIIENTRLALGDLKRQLDEMQCLKTGEDEAASVDVRKPLVLWSCRINAGLFGVPWQRTRLVLERSGLEVTVVRPTGESL
ncbi:predicted protein [Uncinocarpus reesii 1704]|uniref:Uncharacterized protein n=1 Tax=Uncinocarpus reesii (strain UAMH 1704) TaxID=336963 RepID=C4JIQ5_UNCRE|nr:uncharacterized protein UREG_02916 [Uncinocarpus reesii 1704]EEP78067.1 predicted protein [Uncinocarpus reesii 1704]